MMSKSKKLSVAFYWHMHQPVYQMSLKGDYIMPWVRLHAVKDYLDMALWAKKFPNLKLNFNYVPVLLDAIIDYGENNAHDIHSRMTVIPQEKFTDEDKIFILNNFFDANYQTMILPNPEYHRLYQKAQISEGSDIGAFSEQEYADITALFNLAWIDSSFKTSNKELKKLVKKGKNYTLEDRVKIIEIQREIIKKIIPTIKKLISQNKVEITTSPYYHPILPILLDYKNIKKNQSQEDDFTGLKTEMDAKIQTEMALDRIEEIFGKRPRGIWPSEQCISGKTLEMLSGLGVKWSISDEGILANSINCEFEHDFKGYLKEPYHLLKTYQYKTKNSDIKMIFRDSSIPNLISFEYQNHNPLATAADLYDRIKVLQSKILSSPDNEHLLTIALDGENCWENYLEDGASFLKTLYTLITEDETLETVLISDYLENAKENKVLSKIASGSWINRNFKLWIDEPVKDIAWSYLRLVREDFSNFAKREPQNPNIEAARRELFICEGSDWFWWYGEPNDSGRDNIFDFLYRTHLKNVYKYLELDPPKYLDEPLSNMTTSKPSKYPRSLISPEINGKNVTDEQDIWNNAGYIEIPDGPVLRESKLFDKIRFGNDENNFYLKFHLNKYIKQNPDLTKRAYQMYIYLRKANHKQSLSPVRLINKTTNITPVSMEKFHNEIQIAIRNDKLQLLRVIKAIPGDMWVLERSKEIETAYDEVLDLRIPFDILEIKEGETLEFLFVNANFGIKDFYIPNEMVLSVTRPALVTKK
jgi:alpha-amylase/alpha-mannosidase (GH57 family)